MPGACNITGLLGNLAIRNPTHTQPVNNRDTSAFFTILPPEIRILIYEIILVDFKDRSFPARAFVRNHRPVRPELSIRKVCRDVAQETFGVLFNNMDLDSLMRRYERPAFTRTSFQNDMARLEQHLMKGRWSCIRQIQIAMEIFLSVSLQVDFLVPDVFPVHDDRIDIATLHHRWGKHIPWPREGRKVRVITLTDAQWIVGNHWSIITLRLVLFRAYFPELMELRLLHHDIYGHVFAEKSYKINRDGVFDRITEQRVRTLPNIQLVQSDGSVRNTVPRGYVSHSRNKPNRWG
jgi:hypothetical protein